MSIKHLLLSTLEGTCKVPSFSFNYLGPLNPSNAR